MICNDYEYEIFLQKTGMTEAAVLDAVHTLIVTRGEKGSTVIEKSARTDVAAVEPKSTAVAPVNPVPVIVTESPPDAEPLVGLMPVTAGPAVPPETWRKR